MESLELLKNLSGKSINEINIIFQKLLGELQSYLKLEPVESLVKIVEVIPDNIGEKEERSLTLGIKREFEGNLLIIKFLSVHRKYLPIILLREAYYCFIPSILLEKLNVKIVITRIIEADLQNFEFINEWKDFFESHIAGHIDKSEEIGKSEDFFKYQGSSIANDPVIFFINYIRKNAQNISENFYIDMIEEFVLTTSKSMKQDDLIETLQIIIKIFYKVKNYRALLDYQKYFKELKENKEIKTELSFRKFTKNLQLINKVYEIAPSYLPFWNRLNLNTDFFLIKFHPVLKESQVRKTFEHLPFFLNWKLSVNSFAIEASGRFFAPVYYQDDIYRFFSRLENNGFIIEKRYISIDFESNNLNLNYFREFYKKGRIINYKNSRYDKKYEIHYENKIGKYSEFKRRDVMDFIILNRVSYYSSGGFGFERSSETTKRIKSDLFRMLKIQGREIIKLKKHFEKFKNDLELKKNFLRLIEANKNLGFFYIRELLENLLICVQPIINILKNNRNIKNISQLQEYIKSKPIYQLIDKNIILKNKDLQRIIYRDLIPIAFNNISKFNREFKKYRVYVKFLKYCDKLKIFNIESIRKIIENEEIIEKIYNTKKKKLKKIHKNYRIQNIKSDGIESALDSMVSGEHPTLKPCLVNTINTTNFAKYYVELILKDNSKNEKIINNLCKYLPRINERIGIDINSKEKLIVLIFYIPVLNISEKELFISTLKSLFGKSLIALNRYFFDGFMIPGSSKGSGNFEEYYDPEKQDWFYTEDLFIQFYKYIKNVLGIRLEAFKETPIVDQSVFWTPNKSLDKLVNQVDDRVRHEHIEFNIKDIEDLNQFHANLKEIIKNDQFKEIKDKKFFKNYVKSIKFESHFSDFGLGKYFLYIRPTNMNEIDLRLLFANTFYKVKYPAKIDTIPSLFISYIFPYRNPNMAYLNWLTKSKKIISEYCIFSIKRIYTLFHFDYNLSPEGWNLNVNNFKTYMQKILFDPKFKEQVLEPRSYNLDKTNFYDPQSILFQSLTEIQGYRKMDLKSVLGGRSYSLKEKVSILLKNKLIHPYIKLKNMDFKEKIYIILPSIERNFLNVIVKIFSFFNYGFIYEIEGEYFIRGLPEEKRFEHGLMIKLYLPITEFGRLQKIFALLFQYLGIKKYLILNDMINGTNLIKSVYEDLDFLKSYNPLNGLIWNEKDKKWMNHKLFNEMFEVQYPELL